MIFVGARSRAAIGISHVLGLIAGAQGLSTELRVAPFNQGIHPRIAPSISCFHERGTAVRHRGAQRGRFNVGWPPGATIGTASTANAASRGNSDLSSSGQGLTAEQSLGTEDMESLSGSTLEKPQSFAKTLWQFSRPHTMIGTALAIPSLGAFASPPGVTPGVRYLLSTLWALVPSLLINIYITGLNQITDVEIDKINKPQLPIAAGKLSLRAAKVIVSVCLLVGMVLGMMPTAYGSLGLASTVLLSVVIGTSYSLPPVRLKRFPQFAAMCVFVVRGSLINAGFYAHAQTASYGLGAGKPALAAFMSSLREAKCAFALAYFTVFAVVIALMKDVPDVSGDRLFDIPSFSVVFGEKRLFKIARRILTSLLWTSGLTLLVGAKRAFDASLPVVAASRALVAVSALGAGQLVRTRAIGVDPGTPSHVSSYYMFAWKIFYASYLALPFAR